MSALTELFNYLFAYLIFFVDTLFFDLNIKLDYMSPSVQEAYYSILENLTLFVGEENIETWFMTLHHVHSYMLLPIGIFVVGAIIGLVRRLVK